MQEEIISISCSDGSSLEVTLYSWDLRRQLREQNVIIPLIKEPFVNAMAIANSFDEEMQVLSIIEGVLSALAGIDLEKLSDRLVEGVYFRPKNGASKKPATIDALANEGVDLAGILQLCTAVIKQNYGTLLKKDLMASFLPVQEIPTVA